MINKKCVICGKEFECKINSKAQTCSKHCSNIKWHRDKKETQKSLENKKLF